MTDLDVALPTVLSCSKAFQQRVPTQRLMDELRHQMPGLTFAEMVDESAFRILAFRILMRDYPGRDLTSLWMHAYDCEVDVLDDDPFELRSPGPSPPSAITGTASPTT